MCCQIDGKFIYAAKCVTSRIMDKVIDCVFSIDKFEQTFVVHKGMLQSPRLKDHMKTIGIGQSFSNIALFKKNCIQSINKLYKHAGKCDNQKKFKDII